MSSLRVVVGIICLGITLVGRGIWTETAVNPPRGSVYSDVSSDADTTAVSDTLELDEASRVDVSAQRRMDRYGNEIETAIGDYRIDPRGDIYERHSPDTAVPRLNVPTT